MKYFISIIFVLLITNTAYSQYGSVGSVDAKSMGLAKTYNSTANGIYAIGLNPAYMVNTDDVVQFSLPQFSLRTGNSILSTNLLNKYFVPVDGQPKHLTEADKDDIINLFDGGGKMFTDANMNFSLLINPNPSIGTFGLSFNNIVGVNATLPQDLVELAFRGTTLDKVYDFSNTSIKSWFLQNIALSYAREFPEFTQDFFDRISVGVSLKFYRGITYVGTERMNTSLGLQSNFDIVGSADMIGYSSFSKDFAVDYDFDSLDNNQESEISGPFPKPAGTGVGFDFGFMSTMDKWSFSFAVTDIGSIKWTENAAMYSAVGEIFLNDLADEDQLDSLEDKLTGEGKYIESFETKLPTALRMGAAYSFEGDEDYVPGDLTLAIGYNQGFNDMPGNSKIGRVSLGADWNPGPWIPYIRTGLSFGGPEKFNWALGLGFTSSLFEFHIATSDFNSVVSPNDAKTLSFAMSSIWKF